MNIDHFKNRPIWSHCFDLAFKLRSYLTHLEMSHCLNLQVRSSCQSMRLRMRNAVRTEACVFDWTLCPRPDGLLVQGMEASPGCSKGPLCPASDKRSTSLRELFRRSWLKPSCYLASLQPSRTAAKIVRWTQCDQIAKLFAQYFDIYNNENLPNGKNISKSRLKNMPITQ